MVLIRINRFRKYRKKNQPIVLSIKVIAIGYMTFGTLYYLSSSTNASFSDTETVNAGFVAKVNEETDKPVDKNSLKITVEQKSIKGLTVAFINTSESTLTNIDYQLYFSEEGSPKDGAKLVTESIKKLKKAEEAKLDIKPIKGAGKYILKVTLSKNIIIWSEEIVIPNGVEKEKGKESDSAPDKPKENNEEAQPNDTNLPKDLNKPKDEKEKPEPDQGEKEDEVEHQEAEQNVDLTEENNSRSDEVDALETVDNEVGNSEKVDNNNE